MPSPFRPHVGRAARGELARALAALFAVVPLAAARAALARARRVDRRALHHRAVHEQRGDHPPLLLYPVRCVFLRVVSRWFFNGALENCCACPTIPGFNGNARCSGRVRWTVGVDLWVWCPPAAALGSVRVRQVRRVLWRPPYIRQAIVDPRLALAYLHQQLQRGWPGLRARHLVARNRDAGASQSARRVFIHIFYFYSIRLDSAPLVPRGVVVARMFLLADAIAPDGVLFDSHD